MTAISEKIDKMNEIASFSLKVGQNKGATAVEIVAARSNSIDFQVREQAIESLEGSEREDLSVRVLFGQRQAAATTSDLSHQAIEQLVSRVCEMAKASPEDQWASIANEEDLSDMREDLDSFDQTELSAQTLEELALTIERTGLEKDGITASLGASASSSQSFYVLHASNGFQGAGSSSGFSLSGAFVTTDKNNVMERDYFGRSKSYFEDLPSAAHIGAEAAKRTLARRGSQKLSSQVMPVLFDKRVSSSFLGMLIGAISGAAVARGISFLKDDLDSKIFNEDISIVDDPFLTRGHGSRQFDGEGVAVEKRKIIDNGVLTTWLHNTVSAKQLAQKTTGHASTGFGGPSGIGTSNFYLEQGKSTYDEIVGSLKNGLIVTDMFGPSFNANNGDWSVGIAGFHAVDGAIAEPVSEVTVAGNMKDIFARLVPADDLEFNGSVSAPSIFVDQLAIAGV